MLNHGFGGGFTTGPGLLVAMAEEQVGDERNLLPQGASQEITGPHPEFLADEVDAGEFDGGMDLVPAVVERRGRVAYFPLQGFELKGIVSGEVGFEREKSALGGFSPTAHLTPTDQALVGVQFHNGADKPAPVTAG
jgi:hypothetical protein